MLQYFNILNCEGNISSCCNDYGMAKALNTIKETFTLITIVVPILLLVMITIQFIQMMLKPDDKKNGKKFLNKIVSACLIFALPTIANVALKMLPDQVEVLACWNAGSDINRIINSSSSKYIKLSDRKTTYLLIDPGTYAKGEERKESTTGGGTTVGGQVYQSGGLPIPTYYQGDYKDVVLYGSNTVSNAGCGFTSCSMIVSYLLGKKITPREFVGDWSRKHYVIGAGMGYTLPGAAAEHYHLGSVEQTTSSSKMMQALREGHPVMSSQSSGLFTSGGHLIVLRGLTSDGKILVNDPNRRNAVGKGYNTRAFNLSEVDNTNKQYFIWPKKV